jgi:SAM-dependent methyltransferase
MLSGVQKKFPQLMLSGSDIFCDALSYAEAKVPGVTLFQMDARHIPFEDEFDVIGALDVLEHIEEDDMVLAQMFRATRRGGGIIVVVPQHAFLWSVHDASLGHRRRYSREELVEKVKRAGFTILCVTSFHSLLLPFRLLSRKRKSKTLDEYDPIAILKVGKLTNVILRGIAGIERAIIKSGIRLPAGGSLLVVARHH